MKDLEKLEHQINKTIDRFQSKHRITTPEMAGILLEKGVDTYIKDVSTRQLNGEKVPYLADFHLRQGVKYYYQDLEAGK